MADGRLGAGEREFLAMLAGVVFGNPFSEERAQLIARLAPGAVPGDLTRDREALARVVEPRLRAILGGSGRSLDRLSAEDQRVLAPAVLYVCYHRHVPQIDDLIERQAQQGGTPLPVPFAGEVIGELVASGFGEAQGAHYFALFFQLRRAFYFIHRSLAGESGSMLKLRHALWNNIFTHDMRGYDAALWNRMEDFSTLLLGETGTGKGSAAAAIGRSAFIPYLPGQHRFAENFTDTFITLNLSQFPETLIESELFGHRKGAFTGAVDHHDGVLARCNPHGALFLDEVGDASVPVQIKLLQVLQERTFTPLGSHERKRFAGRVIAATNRPLGELRRAGRFRDDFFYRLCSDVIAVPTLRQRIEESPGELEYLVGLLVARTTGGGHAELVTKVTDALERDVPRGYPWPGNVRELEQAVRRILLTGRYTPDLAHFPASADDALVEHVRAGKLTAEELLGGYCTMLYRRFGTYTQVAQQTGLDPRTSRKYVLAGKAE